jgi:hypothetical protein|tara:strand:+ start:25810 stop:26001 length:192 start_codon:yes stop_codon:yes gene_type:complete
MKCSKDCIESGCNKECSMIKKISTRIQYALVAAVNSVIDAANWVHAGVVCGLNAIIAGIKWLF